MRPTAEDSARRAAAAAREDDTPAPAPTPTAPSRRRDVVLGLIALAGLAMTALIVGLAVRHRGVVTGPDEGGGIVEALAGPVLLAAGLLVLRGADRRGRPVGAVLTAAGAGWLITGVAGEWIVEGLYTTPGAPGTALAYAISARYGAFLLLGLPLVLLLFPDGHLPRGRVGRPLALASLAGTALLPVTLLVVPSTVIEARSGVPFTPRVARLDLDPHSIPLPLWPAVLDLAFALLPLSMVVPFAVVAVRYRRARGRRRLQLRWLVWAGLVDTVLIAVALLLPEPWPSVALLAAITVTCAAIVVAVLRGAIVRAREAGMGRG